MPMDKMNSNPEGNNDLKYSVSEYQVRIFIHQLRKIYQNYYSYLWGTTIRGTQINMENHPPPPPKKHKKQIKC